MDGPVLAPNVVLNTNVEDAILIGFHHRTKLAFARAEPSRFTIELVRK